MRVGPSSLGITLPFELVKTHKLNKGDFVSIFSEGKIVILKFEKGGR